MEKNLTIEQAAKMIDAAISSSSYTELHDETRITLDGQYSLKDLKAIVSIMERIKADK